MCESFGAWMAGYLGGYQAVPRPTSGSSEFYATKKPLMPFLFLDKTKKKP